MISHQMYYDISRHVSRYPTVLKLQTMNPSTVLKPPTCIMIPHSTEYPPRYSRYPPMELMISPAGLNTPTVLKISPTLIMISPHGTEHTLYRVCRFLHKLIKLHNLVKAGHENMILIGQFSNIVFTGARTPNVNKPTSK